MIAITKRLIKKIIPYFLLDFYHYCLAFAGAFLYGFPSKKMIVIGITGTAGKSTTVEFVAKIFEQAGYETASFSSIKFKIGNNEQENDLKMTMPGRMKIQRFLRQALKSNCKYVVLEVTSEGIKQFRNKFIDFNIAIFTNLSPEHIESHKGFENYRQAKLKLFKDTKKIHIINLDDENT
ncbi:MAG: Mur ligase family protein, partial [Patescibacteria group bacterium]|nr:Mur ligase family protein [Patescibacteria group bacterium]